MTSRSPSLPPDLAALSERLGQADGRRFWRVLEEAADSAPFQRYLAAEFPGFALPETGRRGVLRAMAASVLLAGLGGCGPEEAVPYVVQPDGAVPGRPRFYATAIPFEGHVQPVLAQTQEGRPTRLDGNPDHPLWRGMANPAALDPITQAAVLQLYDPDRSPTPRYRDRPAGWDALVRAVEERCASWAADGGRGVRLLTGPLSSPTLRRQIAGLRAKFPGLRWHSHDPLGSDGVEAASVLAFGRPLTVHRRVERAGLVVSLEDDWLGPGPAQLRDAGGWAARRRGGEGRQRLLIAESAPTMTGAQADRRLAVASARVPLLAWALGRALGVAGVEGDAVLGEAEREWVHAAAEGLRTAGPRGLVTAGPFLPVATQALAHRINHALGTGAIIHTAPILARGESLANLVADMERGVVGGLILLDTNPAYDAPEAGTFAAALERVPFRLHAGSHADETATLCHWHAPLAHPLESWSDGRAVDGTASVVQPAIRPLFGGKSVHAVLALLTGEPSADPFADPFALVRATWDGLDDAAWREALDRGFIAGTAEAEVASTPLDTALPPPVAETSALEVTIRPDPNLRAGAAANCAWLQELPTPVAKTVWGNHAAIAPALARARGLADGDEVELAVGERRLRLPVLVQPGQVADSVALTLGHGRRRAGRVGDGVGVDVGPLRKDSSPWTRTGATLTRTGGRTAIFTTQRHHGMGEAEPIRFVTPDRPALPPIDEAPPSLHPDRPSPGIAPANAWAMAIDTDLCIGCNACVTACQAENNTPPVGREQAEMGRVMHWLRVDSYYEGPAEDPAIHALPVPCMQCEKAPCEIGCPVNATVHSPDGINEQVYNRCIGTRTCSSYCPYKVRRFNFFEYAKPRDPLTAAQYNPEVTVRARGVMEKCNYCIQRIARARQDAKRDGRDPAALAVTTACQAACPTQAIAFGDKNDPASAVAQARRDPRAYALLEEVGTRPRTTYLAKRRPGAGEG
ncbi:TAT-variant-translocated molybdopterin oxidoreductase [Azospirillum doebereinerae]|uniref:TAT-variant-translocated molybdopterin oxidoreductase n=1 Tax=Azospirillum doebereinerae TaxID=92933 RepID=UPI00384C1609